MNDKIEIDRDDLEILLWFAKAGDVAKSQRSWRNWFRKHPVCSGDQREGHCFDCGVFTRTEKAVRS